MTGAIGIVEPLPSSVSGGSHPLAIAAAPVALVVAVPLAVAPGAALPFLPVKWMVLGLVVPVGLVVAALTTGLRWPAWRWWAAWSTVLVLATALGAAPWMSVAGSPQRNMGILAWAFAAGAFVLGASVGGATATLAPILRAAMVAAGVVALVALAEVTGLDLVGFGDLDVAGRARSTWGSATFLGGYLVLIGPIALLQTRSRDPRWRAVAVGCSVLGAAALVATGTRAAWAGAAVAVAVVAVARPGPRALRIAASVAAAVVVVVAVAIGPVASRSSGSGRLDLWSVAVRAAGERPLLGSGPDTQRLTLPAQVDDGFEAAHGSEELHDRAHNLVLDTALTTGVVGLVALGGLLVAVGRRAARVAARSTTGACLAAGLAGYLTTLVFGFSEPTLDALAWLMAGLLVATPIGEVPRATWPRRHAGVAAGGFAALAVLGAIWCGGEVLADHRLARAVEHTTDDPGAAVDELLDAATTAPSRFDIAVAAARLLARNADPGPDQVERVLAALDDGLRWAPDDPEILIARADLLRAAGDPSTARTELRGVLDGPYPSSSDAWLTLGVTEAELGDVDAATKAWERAAALAPTDARPWRNLTRLHRQRGEGDAADEAAHRADRLERATTERSAGS